MQTWMSAVLRIWSFVFEKIGGWTGENPQGILAGLAAFFFDKIAK